MKNGLLKILLTWMVTVVVMQLCRLVFVGLYYSLLDIDSLFTLLSIMAHGLAMDCSIAGYITLLPAALVILSVSGKATIANRLERLYYTAVALLIATVTVVDAGLYGYWDFRLDTTPIFYLTTSPAAALASVEWWIYLVAILSISALTVGISAVYFFICRQILVCPVDSKRSTTVLILTIASMLLFLPIRGGVTVSTMNPSRAYFSVKQRHNHAAINPLFSLMYSATHLDNDGNRFEYYDDEELQQIMKPLNPTGDVCDSTLLTTSRPDIYLIILESFSAHLLPCLGGEPIATRLDSVAADGILFTNFYGSSFRTDRALPAILSGFPGQPTTSVMKNVEKAANLPSIARSLNKNGYVSTYYYGGDLNFTNMLAYLINSGFSTIIGDRDFTTRERASKWGAHDGVVFDRAICDAKKHMSDTTSRFVVIQTSSSHEPYKVPLQDKRFIDSPRKNCFAYTDLCLSNFLDSLKHLPSYNQTLVIIVPDHQGVYPSNLDENASRHHLPLILTGGALARRGITIDSTGSQVDIAATLLGMIGIGHCEFRFSKNMLDSVAPRFAFFSAPATVGFIDKNGRESIYNIDTSSGSGPGLAETRAYLQSIYRALRAL